MYRNGLEKIFRFVFSLLCIRVKCVSQSLLYIKLLKVGKDKKSFSIYKFSSMQIDTQYYSTYALSYVSHYPLKWDMKNILYEDKV